MVDGRAGSERRGQTFATVNRAPRWAGFSSSSTTATAKSSALIWEPAGLSLPVT